MRAFAHLCQNKPFPLLYLGHAQIIICFSLKDFRQQSPTLFGPCPNNNLLFFEKLETTVSHTSVERFSVQSKTIITINSVYIRSMIKRELVNMYREDFQSILRKQRPFPLLRNVIPPRSWVADQGPLREIWLYFFKSR